MNNNHNSRKYARSTNYGNTVSFFFRHLYPCYCCGCWFWMCWACCCRDKERYLLYCAYFIFKMRTHFFPRKNLKVPWKLNQEKSGWPWTTKSTATSFEQGKRAIFPALIDVQVKQLSSLRFPNKVCYVSRIFILISNSSFFFILSIATHSFLHQGGSSEHRLRWASAPPYWQEGKWKPRQRRCSCCKERTSYYCSSSKCSLLWGRTPKFLYICQVATRGCYHRHLEKCTKQKSRWVRLSKSRLFHETSAAFSRIWSPTT